MHPIAGYLAEWANVFQYIVVGISEVVATTEYLRFWWPGTSDWIAGIVIILFLLLANLASARAYATLEFWFAMIKVVTIILMIVLGFMVILFGFGNGGHPVGFLTYGVMVVFHRWCKRLHFLNGHYRWFLPGDRTNWDLRW